MPKIVKANGKTFTFEDNVTNEQISSTIDEYFNVKKKVATQPTAPKKQLVSPTQQKPTPTLSDTEETQPPVESDGLGGPPKMKTFTGFTPEEQQTLQAKPVSKISKSSELIGKKLKLQKELSTAKVTPENQEEISRKTDELAKINKEADDTFEQEKRDLGSKLVDKLATGSSQLGANIAAVPELIYEAFAFPQNYIAKIFEIPSLETDSEKFKKEIGINNAVKDFYKGEVTALNEKSKLLDAQYKDGIYDSFKNGDIVGGFDQLTSSFAESLPSTMSIMVGGAYAKAAQILATSTMIFGAEKNEKLKEENPEMSANARVANSLATGLAQAGTEVLGSGSIGAAARGLFEREGEKKAFSILKDGLTEYYKSVLKKSPVTASVVGEGAEEWASKISENAIDVVTGAKPSDYNVFEGGADAFLGGVFGGAVFGGGLYGLKNTMNNSDVAAVNDTTKNIFNLQSQLENPNIPENIKTDINSKIYELIDKNQKTIDENLSKIESLPEDVKTKLNESVNLISSLTEKAKEINSSEEIDLKTKAILLEDLRNKAIEANDVKSKILSGEYVSEAKPEVVAPAEVVAEAPTTEVISPETSSNYANLTENKDGDFVFFHVGGKGYDKIKKSTGGTTATSKEEGAALSKVGGVAMYYTKPSDTERMVSGEAKYAVTIPKEKVYDANTDPNNYAKEAEALHEEENPGKAFDANSKLAYITKIAGENGFDMVVSEWMGKTRAQTTTELTPTDVQLKEGDKIAKPFEEEYVDNSAKGLKSIVPESKEAKLKAVYDEINGIRNKQNKYDALYKLSSKDLTNVPQEETTKLIEESDLPQEVKDKYAEALAYEPEQRRTVNIVGKTVEVKNAPEGHHLNIGLLEGRTKNVMSAKDVLSKLPKDIKVISHSEIKGTEPSISVEISRPLTASEMSNFLDDTKQQAIPQLSDKKGILYDVKRGSTEGWGDFDPSLFFTQDGNNLAEVKVTEVKQKESSVLKRIKEGGNAEYINEIIDKIGVNYAQRNQQQVISDAEAFVDEVGIEKAYEAIKNGSISNGDSVTVIYASIIDRIPKISENAIEDAKTESKKEAVQKEYNELLETVFDEFSKRQTDIGQATAILNALYIKNQEIMYSLSVQKEKYKAINAGVIDEDTLKKFEALDKRYSEANKKIKELESKLKEAIDEQNFKNIIEEQNRVTSKENIGSKVRNLAKDIRSGKKAILPSWAVAEGAKGAKGQGLTFEKTFAKALETFADVHDATKDFAKAIEEGIKVLKKWYASNNIDFNEGDIRNKFSDYVSPNIKKLTVVKGVIKIPSEIISNYVINVGSDINELSEQILKDSKEEYPNLTVRQIKDQISNYGSKLNKTRSQLAEDILRLKSLGRLESQLEDLKKGISNAKNEVKKRALSDLEKKYIAQIKAIKKNLGIEETERTKANENYVRRRIEELKEKIRNKDFSKKEVTPIKESEELKALKTEKNRVQEEYDKIVYTKELENRTIPEKISGFLSDMWDAQRVTRATGELSFVGAQGGFYMINSTFSRKTFNNLVKNFRGTSLSDWTKSPIKTISNIIKSATSAETIIEMFNKMGTKNNYDDYQSLLKAHPYYDVFVKSKLRILSEDIKTQVRDEMFIGNHFLHILKLPFTALTKFEKGKKRVTLQGYYEKLKTGEVSEKNVKTAEEIFEAVNPLGVFERGNNTFMNMARVEMFMDGVQALEIQGKNPTDHLDDYKKLASAVNTITGSGNLSQQISMALPKLNKLFFSPRFWAASLNMTPPISLYYLAKLGNYDNVTLGNPKSWGSIKPTVAQKAFVKPMLKGFIAFYGMSTLVVSLINAALDDDDEMTEEEKAKKRAYIEYDPRSSNFMQVISGDTKTDFFGPYRGNMVLFSRLFTGQTKKDGNIIENGAKWGSRTDFQIATEYIAGKANPFPGMFVRYSMGKKEEVLNEETNLKENRRMLFDERVGIDYQAKENLLPIFVGTIKAIQDEDPVLGSEFYTTLALFGKQTSVYKKKQKETTGRELSGNRSESGSRESSGTRSESGTRE